MRSWAPDIDPATIPDSVLKTERARRNAAKRGSYSGGAFWKAHNPQTSRCRCQECMIGRSGVYTRDDIEQFKKNGMPDEELGPYLYSLSGSAPHHSVRVRPSDFSAQFHVNEEKIWESLFAACESGAYIIDKFDAHRKGYFKPQNWPSREAFKDSKDDGGYVRLRRPDVEQ
jgi:hypothetical protein